MLSEVAMNLATSETAASEGTRISSQLRTGVKILLGCGTSLIRKYAFMLLLECGRTESSEDYLFIATFSSYFFKG